MALDPDITAAQVKAKAPVDEQLMTGIRDNLENFDQRLTLSSGADFSFKINGELDLLDLLATPANGIELDAAFVAQERTLQVASIYLDEKGAGGDLEINVRRLKFLGRPISGIKNIFTANTQSIVRGSAALPTQSITKAEADVPTQSISYAKIPLNIDNITQITGASLFRLNLEDGSIIDEDYVLDKYILISGCTDANNDGVFQIKQVNKDNGINLVVENLLGVVQALPAGSIQLLLVSYTALATIPDNFAEGEDFVASGHTDPSNDGTFTIHKTNVGGNNIIVYKTVELVPQVGAVGNAEVLRFQYNFLTAVLDAFTVGEIAEFSTHSSAANDGSLEIKQVNNGGGNNIVVYNSAGVLQAVPAGNVNSNRWVYALDLDPDGFFQNGDTAVMTAHTNALNDGNFIVVDVKYLATNNIVIYNAAGVEQLGIAGVTDHAQKAITFREDYSTDFEVGKSDITIKNTKDALNDGTFKVIAVNRIAVSPYNIICELTSGLLQVGDDGVIDSEVRSIFTNGSVLINVDQDKTVHTVTGINDEITDDPLANDTILLLDVLQVPANSVNLSVNIK